MRTKVVQRLAALPLIAGLAHIAFAQQNQKSPDTELHVLPVQGNIYMLVGAGANIAMSIGRDGILLVDTGTKPMADHVLATALQLATAIAASPVPNRCHDFDSRHDAQNRAPPAG